MAQTFWVRYYPDSVYVEHTPYDRSWHATFSEAQYNAIFDGKPHANLCWTLTRCGWTEHGLGNSSSVVRQAGCIVLSYLTCTTNLFCGWVADNNMAQWQSYSAKVLERIAAVLCQPGVEYRTEMAKYTKDGDVVGVQLVVTFSNSNLGTAAGLPAEAN